MRTIGFCWLEDKQYSKDGVHYGSIWWGICKRTMRVAYLFVNDSSKIFLLPNVEISWDDCNFQETCLNIDCPYCQSDDFSEQLQKTELCWSESLGMKQKRYSEKLYDLVREVAWLLQKEIQQNDFSVGELSDMCVCGDFMFTNTQYMPSYLSSVKKEKKKKKNKRKPISGNVRQNVFMRDKYTCQICGATVKDGAKLELDHIVPVSKGGSNKENNLQTLCRRCNREKRNRSDLLHDKLKLGELNGNVQNLEG